MLTDVLSNPGQALQFGAELAHSGEVVVFIDLGGNREYSVVASVIILVLQKLNPVLVVAKCRDLHCRLGKLYTSSNIKSMSIYEEPVAPIVASPSFWNHATSDAAQSTRILLQLPKVIMPASSQIAD